MSEQVDKATSRYSTLEKPTFSSAIPPHLTAKLSDQERYLVETLSKMEQQNAWLMSSMIVLSRAIVDIDADVQQIKDFKKLLISKWSVIFWFVTISTPILLKSFWDWFIKKGP